MRGNQADVFIGGTLFVVATLIRSFADRIVGETIVGWIAWAVAVGVASYLVWKGLQKPENNDDEN